MKAAVFEDIKKIVIDNEYPKPEPGSGEVLIRVKYCAICGSDITNFKFKLYQTPLIMGHEFSGLIEKIGEGVKKFKVGDKVIGLNVLGENYSDITGIGIFKNGGFAEYVIVGVKDLFHIPDSISFEDAAMIESFSVVKRAIKYSDIKENEKVAIVGGGNIGLITLVLLKAIKNPSYVIVIEPHEYLRNQALEMGADDVFPPSKVKLRRYFKKKGDPNYVFECAGNENALDLAIGIVNRQGTIILEGVQKGSISLPIFMINNKEITLRGTLSHDRDDVNETINLIAEKVINPSLLISETLQLDEIQQGFERFLEPGERTFIKLLVKIE